MRDGGLCTVVCTVHFAGARAVLGMIPTNYRCSLYLVGALTATCVLPRDHLDGSAVSGAVRLCGAAARDLPGDLLEVLARSRPRLLLETALHIRQVTSFCMLIPSVRMRSVVVHNAPAARAGMR